MVDDSLRPDFANRLLRSLDPADLKALMPCLERIVVAPNDVFETPDTPISHGYFFENGFASIVSHVHGTTPVEVGLIGSEGFVGFWPLLGTDRSPLSIYAQSAGHAFRIAIGDLMGFLPQHAHLRTQLLKFIHVFLIQAAGTALANSQGSVEARLARWLLMGQDRVNEPQLNLTHQFLSIMLGVRRPGITVALQILEGRKLIRALRSTIVIIDRPGLEAASQGFYGMPEAEYRRVFNPPPPAEGRSQGAAPAVIAG